MLIKCSECNKEISDKASSCPHCGCPVTNSIKIYKSVTELNKDELYKATNKIDNKLNKNNKFSNTELYKYIINFDINGIVRYIKQFVEYSDDELKYYAECKVEQIKRIKKEKSILKCPKCGSTAITTGARGVNFTLGLIGASKTVNRCANCGHTWKPTAK